MWPAERCVTWSISVGWLLASSSITSMICKTCSVMVCPLVAVVPLSCSAHNAYENYHLQYKFILSQALMSNLIWKENHMKINILSELKKN